MPIVLKRITDQDSLTVLEYTDWLIKDNADGSKTERFTVQNLIDALAISSVGSGVQWFDGAINLRANTNYLPGNTRVFFINRFSTGEDLGTRMYKFVEDSLEIDDGSYASAVLKPDNILVGNPGRYIQQI